MIEHITGSILDAQRGMKVNTSPRTPNLTLRTELVLSVPLPTYFRKNGQVNWDSVAHMFPDYLIRVFHTVKPHLTPEDTTDFYGLWDHEHTADRWIDVLHPYPGINKLIPGKPKSYLYFLNYLHDAYRHAGNGLYSLDLTEKISGWYIEKIVYSMFKPNEASEILQHLHTMSWITGKEKTPDPATAPNPKKIGLLFAGVDPTAKLQDGIPVHPKELLREGGRLDRWGLLEESRRRLPFTFQYVENGRVYTREIGREEYVANNKRLIRSSYNFLENSTGRTMHQLWSEIVNKFY